MDHNWQYTKMWQYFDYDSDAIYTNSEAIASLPESVKKEVYVDISSRMKRYILSLLPNAKLLNQFVGTILNDIYRTMNKAMYYTHKQSDYLKATAMVVTGTLLENGITIHFGTDNTFANVVSVKLLFSAMWEDCGFCSVDVYSIAEKLTNKVINSHKELITAYEDNKAEVLMIVYNTLEELHKASRSYALMIPDGKDEFGIMLNTIKKPGSINLLKLHDADSSKYHSFEYTPPVPQKVTTPTLQSSTIKTASTPSGGNSHMEQNLDEVIKAAHYLINELHPLYVKVASAEKEMYRSILAKKTKAKNLVTAFQKINDLAQEAFASVSESLPNALQIHTTYPKDVYSAYALFQRMVVFRVDVLNEFVQNGISNRAKELNQNALEIIKQYDSLMVKLRKDSQEMS